jgi:hypothetical protein
MRPRVLVQKRSFQRIGLIHPATPRDPVPSDTVPVGQLVNKTIDYWIFGTPDARRRKYTRSQGPDSRRLRMVARSCAL